MTRDQRAMLLRAVGAIGLPVAAVLLGRTVFAAALWDTAVSIGWAAWLMVAVLLLLATIEASWIVPLWHVLRFCPWQRSAGSGSAPGSCLSVAQARMQSPGAVAHRRIWWMRITAIASSVALTLLVIEAGFRVFDVRPPRPGRQVFDVPEVDYALNALGIREDWGTLADDDPRVRIAFLGDSITYGHSVELDETFCHRIELMLTSRLERGVVTINMGKSGTNPGEQVEIYRRLGSPLRPDIVVHVLYPNDLNGLYTHAALLGIYALHDNELWLSSQSHLFRYLERQVRTRLAMRKTLDYFRGGSNTSQRRDAWAELEKGIREVQNLVEHNGAIYCVVFHPWLFRLDRYPLAAEHVRMEGFIRELGVPYLDLLPAFQGRRADELRISSVNEHANSAGHEIAARHIARFLEEQVLRNGA